MTQDNNTERCDGCGKTTDLTETHGNEFCQNCRELATAIQEKPETIKRICSLIKSNLRHNENGDSECQISELQDLPEVLDAVRFRTRDRELNTWYVSVSELEGDPVEIFASTAFDRDDHLQSRISNLTTITRLVSLILRNVFLGEVLTLEKTIKQLQRSSRQKNDLPDMLTSVLNSYRKEVND
jgi:nitrogen regulatory protein PII